MKGWILSRVMGLALPLVLGPLAFLLTQWLKRSIAALDGWAEDGRLNSR